MSRKPFGPEKNSPFDIEVVPVKKSSSYRETFRRHRTLLIAPIIVATCVAAWLVLGSAKSYESTATVWVDYPAPADSSLGNLNPAELPPSQQEQNVVGELLATQNFVLTVGRRSALAAYLQSDGSSGFGPGALLSKISGGGGSLDSKIIAAIGASQVTTAVPGPQVLQINYVGPTPVVAQSVLTQIVKQLQDESARFIHFHAQDNVDYYRGQVRAATTALTSARAQADAYRAQHPSATTSSDPNLAALVSAVSAASNQVTQANASLSGASSALTSGAAGTVLQVIDPASLPTSATSGKKKILMGLVGGLLAGTLISFLGVVALTRGRRDPWEDELAESMAPNGASSSFGTALTSPAFSEVRDDRAPAGSALGEGDSGYEFIFVQGESPGDSTS